MDPSTTGAPSTTTTEPQPQDQTTTTTTSNNNNEIISLTPLPNLRIPGYPTTPLLLSGAPLTLLTLPLPSPLPSPLPIPSALATILHAWHPSLFLAFLDLDAWFSLTWTLTLPDRVLEIGRVGTQLTFGTLDAAGASWSLMLSYTMRGPTGTWVPLERESMRGETDLSAAEIEAAAAELLAHWVRDEVWRVPAKGRHAFAVEYAPMDPFSDGIPMSPHWLYAPLDLGTCTTCGAVGEGEGEARAEAAAEAKAEAQAVSETAPPKNKAPKLNRCGRCGMAAYCDGACQRRDWAVHKALCGMGAVERGTAVRISMDGGLIAWDVERRFGEADEESENPHFAGRVMKRVREGARLKTPTT